MIAERVIGFVGHLRRNDFRVGPGETLAALDLLRRQGAQDAAGVRRSLRVLLTSRQEEWQRFDELFEAWWFARGRVRERWGRSGMTSPGPPPIWQDHLGDGRALAGGAAGDADHAAGDGEGRLVAAREEVLRRTDLRHIADPEAMREAERIAYR
ncbi:MAG: domain containing CoxE-like protein, partial [Geminicoccaceae bacterium]|nr:domain containing CoxE-like protein [Geminicoccaceae bacterium]